MVRVKICSGRINQLPKDERKKSIPRLAPQSRYLMRSGAVENWLFRIGAE